MKKLENRGGFEEQWKQAFEDAELPVGEAVWLGIENNMMSEEIKSFRNTLFYIKAVAASFVIILLSVGTLQFEFTNAWKKDLSIGFNKPLNTNNNIAISPTKSYSDDKTIAASSVRKNVSESFTEKIELEENKNQTALASLSLLRMNTAPKEPKLRQIRMFESKIEEEVIFNRTENIVKVWAGPDFSPSLVSQNMKLSPETNISAFDANSMGNTLSDQTSKFSFQTGVNGGIRLSSKLSIESGLQFLQQSSNTTTNIFIASADNKIQPSYANLLNNNGLRTSTSEYEDPGMRTIVNDNSEIKVRNVYEYISVPVKVSYSIPVKKMEISLGGGLATDIFMTYKADSKSNTVADLKVTDTGESAFKRYNFSALINPNISYRVGEKLSIMVSPHYKKAILSYTEKNTFSSLPQSIGIGFGLKYKIK